MIKKKYFKVLSIAGSDCSGGAGIQADLKTFTVFGCYGATVITTLTAQNTTGVQDIFPVDPEFIGKQIDSILNDIKIDAIKIGMLYDSKIISIVAEKIKQFGVKRVILDPVMVATSGDRLLKDDAINTLIKELMPLVMLVTPNIKEAELLSGINIKSKKNMEEAANLIKDLGVHNVLIKGGDFQSKDSNDCLLYKSQKGHKIMWFKSERIKTKNTHGTGCTLSSAITCCIAKGYNLNSAVSKSKKFLTSSLKSAISLNIGQGSGPVDHLYRL
jgi:hydroxymethylpyrimidine/phosphomethylpyrimidine kinase